MNKIPLYIKKNVLLLMLKNDLVKQTTRNWKERLKV